MAARKWIDKPSLERLERSARLYAGSLLGKEIGFVSERDGSEYDYITVEFKAQHFAHLAGVKSVNPRRLGAADLFEKALAGKLRPQGIVYTHNRNLFNLKNELFAELAKPPDQALQIAEYGIDSAISINATKVAAVPPACLGLLEVGDDYIPTSLLSADIRVLAANGEVYPVIATTTRDIGRDEPARLKLMKGRGEPDICVKVVSYLEEEKVRVAPEPGMQRAIAFPHPSMLRPCNEGNTWRYESGHMGSGQLSVEVAYLPEFECHTWKVTFDNMEESGIRPTFEEAYRSAYRGAEVLGAGIAGISNPNAADAKAEPIAFEEVAVGLKATAPRKQVPKIPPAITMIDPVAMRTGSAR